MAALTETPSRTDPLLETMGRGRPFAPGAQEVLSALFGANAGREGLSRVFQPGFPGVRTFLIEAGATSDSCVEATLVGIARDGGPVWNSPRVFVRGHSGALEIHHGFDEVDPEYRSRNLIVDTIRRELELLRISALGPGSRITVDAEGAGRYICALHGFVFADQTDEGPPIVSVRFHDPPSDRDRLIAAAPAFIRRIGKRYNLEESSIEGAIARLCAAKTPWAIAAADLPDAPLTVPDGDDGIASGLGRAFLLADDTPSWRAALYLEPADPESRRVGDLFRQRQTARSEARLASEVQAAREQLFHPQRATKIRSLEILGRLAASWVLPDVKALVDDPDRRVAAIARQTVRKVTGADLAEEILVYANNRQNDPQRRGRAYRVLAEYFPAKLEPRLSLLKVDPDARIQRAVIPCLAADPTEAGPELAIMLAANPWADGARPGLLELRVELIDRLAVLGDPRSLPVLMGSVVGQPPPPPAEMLSLSRALLASPDPRARLALSAATQRLDRPLIP